MQVNRLVKLLAGATSNERTLARGQGVASSLTGLTQRRHFLVGTLTVNDILVCSCSSPTHFVFAPPIRVAGLTVAAACCDSPYAPPSLAMPAAQIQL